MGRFSASFQLVKLAFRIINKEKELLVYSLLSVVSVVLVILSFFMFLFGLSFTGILPTEDGTISQVFDIAVTFVFYFLLIFVGLFFNTAIITTVDRVLKKEENKFMDGIKSAFQNIGKITKWAFVSAFVSTILKVLQDRVPFIGKIVIAIIGAVWNIAVYFAFPLMVLGDKKVIDALKESPMLIKKGWGETAILGLGVGFFFFILITISTFLGIILIVLAAMSGSGLLLILMIALLVLTISLLILLSSTTSAVIRTLLYVYLQTGVLPDYIDTDLLGQTFKEK